MTSVRLLRSGGRKHLPVGSGSFPVGCVDIMTEYSSTGCLMRLFYPASQDDTLDRTMQWPLWIPSKEYVDGFGSFLRVWLPLFRKLYQWLVGDVYIPAVWKAVPLRGMTFPVLIYSHGLGGCRTAYSATCVEFASHGFLVAAVEHRDHSACLSFFLKNMSFKSLINESDLAGLKLFPTEGLPTVILEWIKYQRISREQRAYSIRNRQVYQRARECIKALDVLLAINKGEQVHNLLDSSFSSSQFQGILDPSRVAVAGHSFGGVTVMPTLAADNRFKAGVALDSWMFPLKDEEGVFSSFSQPVFCINTERFQTAKNIQVMKRLLTDIGDRRIITIRGTVHHNQSDVPFIIGPITRMLIGCNSSLDRFIAKDLSNCLMLSFLCKHLDLPTNPEHEALIEKYAYVLMEEFIAS